MPLVEASEAQFQPAFARGWSLELPDDPRTVEDLADIFDEAPRHTPHGWWVAMEPDAVGALIASVVDDGGKHRLAFLLTLDPRAETPILPEALAIIGKWEEKHALDDSSIWATDQTPDRVRFFLDHGLHLVQTVPVTRLDLADWSPHPFAAARKRVEARGVRLCAVADLLDVWPEWKRALHEATNEMVHDVPSPHPRRGSTFEQFEAMLQNRHRFDPRFMFVALEGQRIVGYSRVARSLARPDLAYTGLSGVVRTHRRQGIMRALKAFALERLQAQGYTQLQTDNDETNPMYRLNLDLGFRLAWSYLQLQRTGHPPPR